MFDTLFFARRLFTVVLYTIDSLRKLRKLDPTGGNSGDYTLLIFSRMNHNMGLTHCVNRAYSNVLFLLICLNFLSDPIITYPPFCPNDGKIDRVLGARRHDDDELVFLLQKGFHPSAI